MTIDAAALDKPICCIAFEKDEQGIDAGHLKGIFYHSHYRKLVDTQALRLVFNEPELVDAINGYLRNPALDNEGRERLRSELCYRLDGKSAQRTAQCVLQTLGISPAAIVQNEDVLLPAPAVAASFS
jgi:CDP-glycerol glycerophosphotransferase (TagB/SpsB family)